MTEKKYYTSQQEVVASKENPWALELAHTIKKGKSITGFASTKHELVDTTTGETEKGRAVLGVQKVVDKEEFVKIYGAGIVMAFDLTKPAQDLFRIVLRAYLEQKNAPDQLYLSLVALRDFGYMKSRPTYTNGLNEICVKGFLAPVKDMPNLYWVNPHLFYKGDRMRIVQDYVLQGSASHRQMLKDEAEERRRRAGSDQQALPLN